jgi:hypothetical protein
LGQYDLLLEPELSLYLRALIDCSVALNGDAGRHPDKMRFVDEAKRIKLELGTWLKTANSDQDFEFLEATIKDAETVVMEELASMEDAEDAGDDENEDNEDEEVDEDEGEDEEEEDVQSIEDDLQEALEHIGTLTVQSPDGDIEMTELELPVLPGAFPFSVYPTPEPSSEAGGSVDSGGNTSNGHASGEENDGGNGTASNGDSIS